MVEMISKARENFPFHRAYESNRIAIFCGWKMVAEIVSIATPNLTSRHFYTSFFFHKRKNLFLEKNATSRSDNKVCVILNKSRCFRDIELDEKRISGTTKWLSLNWVEIEFNIVCDKSFPSFYKIFSCKKSNRKTILENNAGFPFNLNWDRSLTE